MWAAVGAVASASQGFGQQRALRPNVLLILSDDQGYGDLSSHGNPDIRTPNLDRFSGESTEFTRFYVCPVCAPTRAGLLTGRYNVRTGVHGVTAGKETMPADETTFAETFRGAGYRTALIGKWHLGETWPNLPHAQGFETFIGMRNGHWNDYFDAPVEHNGKPYTLQGYIADALTDESIRYLEGHRAASSEAKNPFFLYLAYNTPHTPYQVPDKYWKKFVDRGMPIELAAIYGMVENLDENVGRVLAALDRLDLANDTIVIFLTDNGPNGKRYTAGLRGQKGAVYEGGVRVPFFFRWPGRVRAGRTVDRIAANFDIYPTLADICGVDLPDGRPLDGVSLKPLLMADAESPAQSWPDRPIFTHREREGREAEMYPGAIRTQRYNLVNGTELYDMEKDPGESNNIAEAHPELVRELRGRYEDWFHTALAERGFKRFPIRVGYPEENPVTLPATQAYHSGKIRFHGKFGYSHDWLTDWTDIEDRIWWEAEIVRAGVYEVTLEYLCPEDSLGAELELVSIGGSVKARVAQATPMDPLPDRNLVVVAHYQTMAWSRLSAGRVRLEQGRTRLELKAVKRPGPTMPSIKSLILRKLESA